MTRARLAIAALLALAASAAAAQQLYRWTDEKGRTHITDTPASKPFELAYATREFPVTLYTSASCQEWCENAREALKRRAVPFREVRIEDEAGRDELKKISGTEEVPVLLVGRSVHRGFDRAAYDALLDSARYPKARAK